ncbi:TrmH family RNA methyltransferase, partial [Streptomyces scabiei]|uniref:hypothetical protein n=1 Tax=Streptomyces scabiei TaxID=1930 RepID=UPI0038F6F4D8
QGEKNVLELLASDLAVVDVFATPAFISQYQTQFNKITMIEADEESLTKASTLVSNNAAIAVVAMPTVELPNTEGLILALDGVSDPGNL